MRVPLRPRLHVLRERLGVAARVRLDRRLPRQPGLLRPGGVARVHSPPHRLGRRVARVHRDPAVGLHGEDGRGQGQAVHADRGQDGGGD